MFGVPVHQVFYKILQNGTTLCLLPVRLHQGKRYLIVPIGAELSQLPGSVAPECPGQSDGVDQARYPNLYQKLAQMMRNVPAPHEQEDRDHRAAQQNGQHERALEIGDHVDAQQPAEMTRDKEDLRADERNGCTDSISDDAVAPYENYLRIRFAIPSAVPPKLESCAWPCPTGCVQRQTEPTSACWERAKLAIPDSSPQRISNRPCFDHGLAQDGQNRSDRENNKGAGAIPKHEDLSRPSRSPLAWDWLDIGMTS